MRAASPSTGFFRITPRAADLLEAQSGGEAEAGLQPEPEPEPEPERKKGTKDKGLAKATSNLYDEDEVLPPPVPMLPCLLRTPQMQEERDQHARFVRSEAAFRRDELDYDAQRRQSRIFWDLIESKEKDRRLVMGRLRKILAEGADVDELSEAGFTVAYTAASRGHADVLEALINNGADCEKESELGVTPLMIAQRRKRNACIELLCPPSATWRGRDLIGRRLHEIPRRATSTPPEAVAVPLHELPASARVLKLTDRDAIEALHIETRQQNKTATPETPRRQHRTTLTTEQDKQARLEQAAKFASRTEQFRLFEREYLDNRGAPGATSPQLHLKTGELPKKATAASRLKSLTVKHAAAADNSKLTHTVVAGAHALLDEQRRNKRDEASWRAEDTARRKREAAREMELKVAQWAEKDAVQKQLHEEEVEAKRLQEIAQADEQQRLREQARLDAINKALGRPKTPEKILDQVTQEFVDHITCVLDLSSYQPPKTPDYIKEQRREEALLTKQLEEEAKLKFEEQQEKKRHLKERKAAAAAAAAAEGDGPSSRPGTRQSNYSSNSMGSGYSMNSGSTFLQDSGLKERWMEDIMHTQQQQLLELEQLIRKLEDDRGVVVSLDITDTPADLVLNIPAKKGTGVAVGLGLNADDDRIENWKERITHVEEAREDACQPETTGRDKIHLLKQASVIIDELFKQVRAAIAIGQRRKSYTKPYEKLSVEMDRKKMRKHKQHLRLQDKRRTDGAQHGPALTVAAAEQEATESTTGAIDHPNDFPVWEDDDDNKMFESNDDGDDSDEGPHVSDLMGRELRTPSPPPTPPPPSTPSAQLPQYKVVKSQLIRAGRDPFEDSKLIGYTEEGDVITALSTATLLTADRKVVQRVQFRRRKGTGFGSGDDIGWVSTKQTKWNQRMQKDETVVLLELVPRPPLPKEKPQQQASEEKFRPVAAADGGADKMENAHGTEVEAHPVAKDVYSGDTMDEDKDQDTNDDEMHKDAKDRNWSLLEPAEKRAVKLLGWTANTWDEGSPHPLENLYWGTKHQGQERALKAKEVKAALLLGFAEEIWDLALHPVGRSPSFQFGLLLHRRRKNMRLWRYEQDALAIGAGTTRGKTL